MNKNSLRVDAMKASVLKFFKSYIGLIAGLVAICVLASFGSPYFLTTTNILNVLRQISTTMCVASASMLIMITGGIDLSATSVLAMGGVFCAGMITKAGWPIWAGILFALFVCTLAGLANGVLAAKTALPPFIITYAVGNVCKGILYIYSNAENLRIDDERFVWIGVGYLGKIPIPVVIAGCVMVIMWFILNKTKLGRNMFAIGGNVQAAQYAGINVAAVRIFMYAFAGFMSGLAGIITTARNYSGQPTAGADIAMDAIASLVLGGVSMGGGKGGVFGAIIGALIIGILGNALNLSGINSYYQFIIKGIVIIVAVYFDLNKQNLVSKKKK